MGGVKNSRELFSLHRPFYQCLFLVFRVISFSFSFVQFSGKVVEPAGAETSMFGSDANALFDVIEKNKKKAAEAAAAALAGGDEDEGGEEGGAAQGGGAGDTEESGKTA